MSKIRVSKDYIGDSCITIKLQGLRFIAKSTESYGGGLSYYLEYGYKGMERRHRYLTKEERDEMYDAVSLLLAQRNNKEE